MENTQAATPDYYSMHVHDLSLTSPIPHPPLPSPPQPISTNSGLSYILELPPPKNTYPTGQDDTSTISLVGCDDLSLKSLVGTQLASRFLTGKR